MTLDSLALILELLPHAARKEECAKALRAVLLILRELKKATGVGPERNPLAVKCLLEENAEMMDPQTIARLAETFLAPPDRPHPAKRELSETEIALQLAPPPRTTESGGGQSHCSPHAQPHHVPETGTWAVETGTSETRGEETQTRPPLLATMTLVSDDLGLGGRDLTEAVVTTLGLAELRTTMTLGLAELTEGADDLEGRTFERWRSVPRSLQRPLQSTLGATSGIALPPKRLLSNQTPVLQDILLPRNNQDSRQT